MSCSEQWKPTGAMLAVTFAFAILNVLLKRILDEGTNHMVLVTYRLAIATVSLAPIAYYWERKSRPKLTAQILCYLFFGALAGATLTQYLFLLGLTYTSATFSCAFLNMVPVSTYILALPLRLEKVNIKSKAGKAKVLGAIICTSAAVLLTLYKGVPLTIPHPRATPTDTKNQTNIMISHEKTHRWIIGSILLMAGCIMWSVWLLVQAKIIVKSYPCHYSSTVIFNFFGAIQSAILSIILKRDIAMWILKGKLDIIIIVYVGVVGSGLSYVVMSWCVKQRGPVFTAGFTPFTQIFAAIFDFTILHEQVYLGSVLGSVVVIIGLYTLLWGKSNEAEEEFLIKHSQMTKEDENRSANPHVLVTMNSESEK